MGTAVKIRYYWTDSDWVVLKRRVMRWVDSDSLLSTPEFAQEIGVDPDHVREVLREMGLPPRHLYELMPYYYSAKKRVKASEATQ